MTLHYSKTDANSTEIQVQTHPDSGDIRLVLMPGGAASGRGGEVYFMPWEQARIFQRCLADAIDEAEKNDDAAEAKRFLKEMTRSDAGFEIPSHVALEYFKRAEAYFKNRS